MAMPMTDNANYHVLVYIAYCEGRAAAAKLNAGPAYPYRRAINPYNPRSPMTVAWNQGLSHAIDDDPLPEGVIVLGLDNPADLHDTLRRIFGE